MSPRLGETPPDNPSRPLLHPTQGGQGCGAPASGLRPAYERSTSEPPEGKPRKSDRHGQHRQSQTGKDPSCVSGRNHACLCVSLSTPALSQAGKRLQNGSELTGVNQPVSNLLEGQLGVPVLEGECSVVRSCLFKRLEIAQVKVQKRNDTIYN